MNECYTCIYRGPIENSRHSCCNHPHALAITRRSKDLFKVIQAIGNGQQIPYLYDDLRIIADTQGLMGGWFCWPVNFDPVWLNSCSGYIDLKKVNGGL